MRWKLLRKRQLYSTIMHPFKYRRIRRRLALSRASKRKVEEQLLSTLSQNYTLTASLQEQRRRTDRERIAKDEKIRRLGMEIAALRHLVSGRNPGRRNTLTQLDTFASGARQ